MFEGAARSAVNRRSWAGRACIAKKSPRLLHWNDEMKGAMLKASGSSTLRTLSPNFCQSFSSTFSFHRCCLDFFLSFQRTHSVYWSSIGNCHFSDPGRPWPGIVTGPRSLHLSAYLHMLHSHVARKLRGCRSRVRVHACAVHGANRERCITSSFNV